MLSRGESTVEVRSGLLTEHDNTNSEFVLSSTRIYLLLLYNTLSLSLSLSLIDVTFLASTIFPIYVEHDT